MRLLPLLLAATCAWAPAAHAQARAPATAAQPDRAARLEALSKHVERGDAAALRQALATERDPDVRTLIEMRLAAMRNEAGIAADPRLQRVAADGTPSETRAAALAIIGGLAFGNGDYQEAARRSAELETLQRAAGKAEDAEQTALTRRLAEMLIPEQPQRLEGAVVPGRGAAQRDIAGLMRVDMSVNGHTQDAVFDTGANLSVLSASTAQRLGVRMLEGDASVGNSVRGTVAVRLGIADRLEIAGNVIRNVVFLVIDDASLTFGGGAYKIPAIVGYPVMQALGRFRVEPTALTVEPASASTNGQRNLVLVSNELFVDARVGGIDVPLYLDTGANPSHLNELFAAAHPEPLAGLARIERRLSGAGGTATGQAVRWSDVPVELAGRSVRMPSLLVGMPGGAAKPATTYGVIGADLLARFASYTIDLKAMRLELGEPLAEAEASMPPQP